MTFKTTVGGYGGFSNSRFDCNLAICKRLDIGGVAAAGHPCAGAIASETFCSHRSL